MRSYFPIGSIFKESIQLFLGSQNKVNEIQFS